MTTTALTVASRSGEIIEGVREAIDRCNTAQEAEDALARVAAVKAAAKAYGRLRDLRVELLALEVAALVRVIELGGGSHLSAAERRAGEWLAAQDPAERARLIKASGSGSAVGVCRAIWREQEEAQHRSHVRHLGVQWASGEPRNEVADALTQIIGRYSKVGRPFEVADMASQLGEYVDTPEGEFEQGVREMCRKALQRSPSEMVDGTVIPMFVTSQLPDGSWVRIPTHAATVADIQSSLEMRQRQLEEDRAALDRFRVFVNKVLAVTSDPTAVIGAVIAATVRDGAA